MAVHCFISLLSLSFYYSSVFFWVRGKIECDTQKKKITFMVFFFSAAITQLWSQELIDLFPLKILEVERDW